ncbi:amidohydrolase family protein [Cellulomonas sp. URHD0024]|uniref:amidohydrolase family protein n=1 Tax=Cellulomonas sp. URHD0024 TaxID=1302620 RepID=UPI0012DE3F18|nr:amidohydrolase family protein [Cellulomonas sp. URHD0024]
MSQLVISGQVAPMVGDVPAPPRRGRVWIRDDAVADVTFDDREIDGFADAPRVDVGDSFVLPGFIDMHNHLAYNVLPLWSEPHRTEPWLHNKHWTQADTYTESVTEPAWTYAKACPEALLGYVQVREMAGGATSAQGWPSSNRGYQIVMRSVDDERAGRDGKVGDDLIYTSVVTKTGDALVTAVRRMESGAGFIYHCAEGQKDSRVRRDFTDLGGDDGLLPTFIGIHCCALTPEDWLQWPQPEAGGVVWSPLSNLVLYRDTTLIDDARSRGVRVCLGSDWGPSGTRNLLGEMKVARVAAHHFGYSLSDRDIVQMVTSNPGDLLARCWGRQIGRLAPGSYADVTVLRGHGPGDAWSQILAATEQHVELVVVGGVPRYGDEDLMLAAGAPGSFSMTVRRRRKLVAVPDPTDATRAWSWDAIMGALTTVQADPSGAIADASARAMAGPRFADDATLELFLDMPDARRTGRAGPPKDPGSVHIPPVPPIEHDGAYFDALDANPIQKGILSHLRQEFGL